MNQPQGPVVVSGVDIPFMDLVRILIKLALASIPAAFILSFIFFCVGLLATGLLGGLGAVAR